MPWPPRCICTRCSPEVKTYAGINQNYAWGQDSWTDFSAAMGVLKPDAKITTSQMPKFGAGQYGAEISALISSQFGRHPLQPVGRRPGSVHAAGRAARPVQEEPAGPGGRRAVSASAGRQHSRRHHRRRARHARRVRARLAAQHLARRTSTRPRPSGVNPNYPAYSTALGFLGLKAAYEKAKIAKLSASIPMGANKGVKEEMEKAYQVGPSQDEIIAAFERLSFESPSGKMSMAWARATRRLSGTAYGIDQAGERQGHGRQHQTLSGRARAAARRDARAPDWIKAGMKPRSK